MGVQIRGPNQDFDDLSTICVEFKATFDPEKCRLNFARLERQVRFGRSLFSTPQPDRTLTVRALDDVLTTFIEETGGST